MNTFNESKIVMVYAIISIFITAIINRKLLKDQPFNLYFQLLK